MVDDVFEDDTDSNNEDSLEHDHFLLDELAEDSEDSDDDELDEDELNKLQNEADIEHFKAILAHAPSANAGKTGIPGRNFPGLVNINTDHRRIHSHTRDYLNVKFIVNSSQ